MVHPRIETALKFVIVPVPPPIILFLHPLNVPDDLRCIGFHLLVAPIETRYQTGPSADNVVPQEYLLQCSRQFV